MCTTFRLSGVRLSSFRMCHNYLFFFLFVHSAAPLLGADGISRFLYSSGSSAALHRWSWRSASIAGLQPPAG
jgi:hypothetical protein